MPDNESVRMYTECKSTELMVGESVRVGKAGLGAGLKHVPEAKG